MANGPNVRDDGLQAANGDVPSMTTKSQHLDRPLNVKKTTKYRESSSDIHTTRWSETRSTTMSSIGSAHMSFSKDKQVTVLRETVTLTSGRFVADFEQVDEHYIQIMTIDGFLEYIERQRLTHMPHRGSRWDKVLKWAEFFGLQVSGYASAIESFVPESHTAAKLIWIACRTLLELGPDNAKALETTFGVFYEVGLSLSFLLRHGEIIYANSHIRHEVAQAFNGLLVLVRDVSIHYKAKMDGMLSSETSLDFTSLFRAQIRGFADRKSHIVESMWREQLGDEESIDFTTLRSWLGPSDSALGKLHEDQTLTPEHRDEYTCEWFQRHLLDFSRSDSDILTLSGPQGCGKTYLSRWVVERLQRPLSRKSYETLFYTVESDVPSTASSLSLAMSLLLQLLEKNVGDKSLWKASIKAYYLAVTKHVTNREIEAALWNAIDVGLDQFSGHGKDHLMIVIDGLNGLKNEDSIQNVTNHLGLFTSKHGRLQAITLSRDSSPKPKKGKLQPFQLKPDHTHEDLRHVAEHAMRGCSSYQDQTEHKRESIIEQLIHIAQGNFLWLLFTIYFLRKEPSFEALEKAVKAAKDAPPSLDELFGKVFETTVDLSRPDVHLIPSWMLVAERPLAAAELKNLLQIDLHKVHAVERRTDINSDVHAALGPLAIFKNDFVRFRHSSIRNYFLSLQSRGTTKLLKVQDAQRDLAMRLLAYCKINLTRRQEPSLELIERKYVDELLHKHVLLEYAVRNWVQHFRFSSLHVGDTLQLPADFKGVFPSSTLLAMLEWSCWSSSVNSGASYELALRVRESTFTEKHECVLQNLIICGTYYRNVAKITDAGTYFYRASRVGQSVLRKHHTLTVSCATTFLNVTENITITTRTETVSRKEETLRFVINIYKHQHGQSHDLVIRYYKMLAELYVSIHEEHKAETVWRELREIVISRYGKGSEEETSISAQLVVVLKRGERKTDVIEYEKGIFDITTELEVWDIRRIQLTLELALSYESRKEFFMAEELYITLWRRLTEQCHHSHHHHHGVEIHIHMIEVALEYVRFLQRCHRHEEACNVLLCVWCEYEEYHFESEILFLRLKTVGELMRSVGLFSVAVNVFKKCWTWFKSRSKTEYSVSCEVLLSETVQEIIETTTTTTVSTSSSTSATVSSTTETVVREVFESTLTRKEITSETISVCKSLVSLYMKSERWLQALEVAKRSLSVIWKLIVSGTGTIALPQSFGVEAIDIAISLAICHHRSHHFHEAEEIYVRVYRACQNSCHVEDHRFVKSWEMLINFNKEHGHWHKMIDIYQELLVQYRKALGATHKTTIRTLYLLGAFCTDHGHGNAEEYYMEIIDVLNHGSKICHVDALDAMLVMCRIHYEAGHWRKLKAVCQVLWETWRDQHHGHHKFTADFIEILYFRYRYVLEHHDHCEYSVLRQLTIEYRNTCIKVFGAAVTVTINASIELAEICMKHESYVQEAVSIYEEVLTILKKTTTTTSTTTTKKSISSTNTTITRIQQSLTSAYISVCSQGTVSTTIIERAVIVVRERFESLGITLGVAHSETLICLRELVHLEMKLKRQSTVVKLLATSCIEIIQTETHSKSLHEAAKILGEVYISCMLTEQGHTLIEDLRLQIVTGSVKEQSSFKLDRSIDKVSYVFLVTFEHIIRGQSASYSEIMADLLTENYLYESYHRCINSQSETVVVLIHAARLAAFLGKHGRKGQKEILHKESFEIFIKKWGSVIKRRDEVGFTFYLALLEELEKEALGMTIGNASCAASITVVRGLLNKGNHQMACEVAACAFDLINSQRAFHLVQNVPYGFKLSALMVGRGLDKPLGSEMNPKIRESMMELSRRIIREVLKACKDSNIDFVRLKLRDLNDLSGLLGEQENFADLEWLLELLWSSREVQRKWKPENIVAIGRRFVQARYLNKDRRSRAIRLCEDICYNLRRVWGSLDPKTLELSDLLAELYTSMGHHREAQGLYEGILRLVVEGDDGDDRTLDEMPSPAARKHLDLLKQSYLRLQGWDKSAATYKDLVHSLIQMYHGNSEWKDATGIETWNFNKEKPSDTLGKFVAPKEWEFARAEDLDEQGDARETKGHLRRPGMGVKRATSNWGIGEVRRVLHGFSSEKVTPTTTNGYANGIGKEKSVSKAAIAEDDDDGYESATEEPRVNGVKV